MGKNSAEYSCALNLTRIAGHKTEKYRVSGKNLFS